MRFLGGEHQRQVAHDPEEQPAQLEDERVRSDPPPIPKLDTHFWTSRPPQASQTTVASPPKETSVSNFVPHPRQRNSYIGMVVFGLFYGYGLDLDFDIFGEACHLDRGARRIGGGEKLPVHGVHGCVMVKILQEHGALYDAVHGTPCRF